MALDPTTKRESTAASPPREIASGIWWLPQCLVLPLSGSITHVHTAPYVILGSEKTLIWDCGTPSQWSDVERSLDGLLGERTVDYVVPSHPEVAHCGNVHRLLAKYPDAELVGDMHDFPFYFPQYADRMRHRAVGSELDLGDRTFVFLDAILKDLPSSIWGYEATQQVLFVADGFAYSHQAPAEGDDRPTHSPGECTLLASELPGTPGPDQIVWITRAALYWTRFVKLDMFVQSFQEMLDAYPPKLVAPAHGAVIDDMDTILWTVWEALRLAYDPEHAVRQAGAAP